jgi:REP-associated tyrosine transposase
VPRLVKRQRLPLREGPFGQEGEPLHEWQDLSHVRWDCKSHVVILPKDRRKVFSGRLRRQVGVILRELCRQRGIDLVEGHAMPDPIHLCLSIPPQSSVAHTIGFLKGKSAVRIPRELLHERRMTGLPFWASGYCVSTVGLDEARVRQYIGEQEELERRQGEFDFDSPRRPQGGLPHETAPEGGYRTEPAPSGGPS